MTAPQPPKKPLLNLPSWALSWGHAILVGALTGASLAFDNGAFSWKAVYHGLAIGAGSKGIAWLLGHLGPE